MDTFKDTCIKHKLWHEFIGDNCLEIEYKGNFFYINCREWCISDGYCEPLRITPKTLISTLNKLTK